MKQRREKLTIEQWVLTILLMIAMIIVVIAGRTYSNKVKYTKEIRNKVINEVKHPIDSIIENRILVYGDLDTEFIILKDKTIWVREGNSLKKEYTLDNESFAMILDLISRDEYSKLCENTKSTKSRYYISYKDGNEIKYCSSEKLENEFGRVYSIIDNIVQKSIKEEYEALA